MFKFEALEANKIGSLFLQMTDFLARATMKLDIMNKLYIGVCGSTNNNQSYSYTHTKAVVNATSYYRVLIPPSDYSEIKSIAIKSTIGFVVTNNPVKKRLSIFINAGNFIEVYNSQGHKVANFKANEGGLVDADVSALSQGIYYFIVYDNQEQIFKNKFLKVDD